MKRSILLSAALLLTAVGCTTTTDNTTIVGSNERTVSVTVSRDNNLDSKISIDTSDSDTWNMVWETGDALTGWLSGSQTTSKFSMVELQENADFATFSGSSAAGTMRLVYPYKADAAINESGDYVIDLSAQSVDMSGDQYSNYADNNLYMVSDPFVVSFDAMSDSDITVSEYPAMSHILPIVAIKASCSDLADGDSFTISSVTISGLKSGATLDFESGELNDDASQGDITISLSNAQPLASGETQEIPFSAIPFTIDAESEEITIKITFTTGDYVEVVKSAPTNGYEYPFLAGTHNFLTATFSKADIQYLYWSSCAADSYAAGDGSADSPFQIATAEQFAKLIDDSDNFDKCFELTADISLEGHLWYPIGRTAEKDFEGTFNGNNHTVSGLSISIESGNYTGLFRSLCTATVTDLTIQGAVKGYQYVGALAGACTKGTTLSNIHNEATVNGLYQYTGGMSGILSNSYAIGCSNKGDVTSPYASTGGLFGRMLSSSTSITYYHGIVINCYNSGTVYGAGSASDYGGIIGVVAGTFNAYIVNCYNSGNVSSLTTVSTIGGVIGYTTSSSTVYINNVYNIGAITNSGSGSCGVLVGTNNSSCNITYGYYLGDESTTIGYSLTSTTDCAYYTEDNMKSQTFVNLLNENAAKYNTDADRYLSLDACTWELDSETGYPTITSTVATSSTEDYN
ncbi:MAG: hypothetical protein SNH63_02115 [Rikenellaceae bacterium]